MRKIWGDEAWEDYLYWQEQDKNGSGGILSFLEFTVHNYQLPLSVSETSPRL